MIAGVEAKSLSGINHLAANPPKFPRNPTEQKHEPLTLYIARVPGTNDIILSTLKPQLKNVTAEDVTTALYYLHLDSEEEIAAEAQTRDREPSTSSSVSNILRKPVGNTRPDDIQQEKPCKVMEKVESMVQLEGKSISRKPLPESARSSIDFVHRSSRPAMSLEQSPASSTDETSPGGLPLMPDDADGKHQVDSKTPMLRKPLGPRPLVPESVTGVSALPGIENQGPNSTTQIKDFAFSSQPEGPQQLISPSRFAEVSDVNESVTMKAFSVTLIRRDPLSGAQWNVGKITGRSSGIERLNRPIGPLARKPFYSMSVHIMNPSYSYFRSFPSASPLPGTRGRLTQAISYDKDTKASSGFHEPALSCFSTDVHMEGEDFWSTALKQRARALSDLSNTRGSGRDRRPMEEVPAPQTTSEVRDAAEAARNRGKGYTFTSIWGGTCKFSTGPSGRNLKCSHTLPGPASPESSTASVVVSDLRFNLPLGVDLSKKALAARGKTLQRIPNQIRDKLNSSSTASPPLPPRPTQASSSALSGDEEAPAMPPRPSPRDTGDMSSDEDSPGTASAVPPPSDTQHTLHSDGDARLDLSLGQEMAGGGNRGKRAKLGKLIIHDEGFKMLDLIVAANMSVWWTIWDSD